MALLHAAPCCYNNLYILQTPLFRVRNKKQTIYCYTDEERLNAIDKLKPKPEITRFKGLGEISPNEFKEFIGKNMRIEPVELYGETSLHSLLDYYMGKNTPERQDFIIKNLRMDEEVIVNDKNEKKANSDTVNENDKLEMQVA